MARIKLKEETDFVPETYFGFTISMQEYFSMFVKFEAGVLLSMIYLFTSGITHCMCLVLVECIRSTVEIRLLHLSNLF